jgi:uncharacterized OB-fold protein
VATLTPHPEGIPLPEPSLVSAPFWEGARVGELRYQRCPAGHPVFNPAPRCRCCGSSDLTWERSAGFGAVYSSSVVWRPQTPAFAVPYVAAIVALDEGYQMLANVIGCEPEDVVVGLRVAVEFHPIGGGFVLPYFRPDGAGDA